MTSLVLALALIVPGEAELQAIADKAVAGTELPGMTAAVAYADGRVIEVAAGMADKESGVKMKVGDRILAGSIGKTWVAALALKLIEEKKLDLDGAVGGYLKDAAWYPKVPNAGALTVRYLLQHTSGIPEHVQDEAFTKAIVANPDKVWSAAELMAFTLNKNPLFEAGKDWGYADTNFVLMGAVIESITGKPMFEQIEKEIIPKAGLKATAAQRGRKIPGLVQGYTIVDGLFGMKGPVLKNGQMPFDPQLEYGGGGVVSTSGDLARWAIALYGGKVVSAESVKLMTAGVPAKTGRGDKYGLGCQIRPSEFGETWGHNGWFPGWLSDVQYFPDKKIAIAVQFNSDNSRASGRPFRAIVADIAKAFSGQ